MITRPFFSNSAPSAPDAVAISMATRAAGSCRSAASEATCAKSALMVLGDDDEDDDDEAEVEEEADDEDEEAAAEEVAGSADADADVPRFRRGDPLPPFNRGDAPLPPLPLTPAMETDARRGVMSVFDDDRCMAADDDDEAEEASGASAAAAAKAAGVASMAARICASGGGQSKISGRYMKKGWPATLVVTSVLEINITVASSTWPRIQ
jgi:hypothetical protein